MEAEIVLSIIAALVLFSGYLIYRIVFKKEYPNQTNRRVPWLQGVALGVSALLIVLLAINLEFCSQQKNRMDKNTTKDNGLDNIGKEENER
ncbi:hypothetical protein [Tellurirhabdus bombi]|uniref:hypothetical protein n=1 Tax=Tellurirhabdus bombi TaxID=2907205 RepID=UPI001F4638D3|nr:hypothetical protein [Tellurirhabdus bombi]